MNEIDMASNWSHGPGWSGGRSGAADPPQVGASVLLASFTLNLLSLGLPIVILQVYDRILPNSAVETLTFLTLGLLGVMVLDGFLRTARAYVTGWSAARFEHSAGCRAIDRLLGSDIGSFERVPPGEHLDRVSAIESLRDFHAGQAKLLLIDLPFVLLFLGLTWFIAGNLVLVPIVLLALLGILAFLVGKALRQSITDRAVLDDRRYSFIIEVLGRIQTVKLLAMEALMQRRYERLQEKGAASTYRVTLLSSLAQNLGSTFSNLTMMAVASAGAVAVVAGDLTIGGLAAATLLSGRAVQPLLRALGLWTQFQNIVIAKDRVTQLFALEPETDDLQSTFREISGAFELKNVDFAYPDSDSQLFTGVNLKVSAGEVVGIAGETGSGKSTLLMLIMNLLRPTSGQVLFDGVDVAGHNTESLRRQIAYLPQNAVLFQGTILDNLAMFDRVEAADAGLESARFLGLDETISGLPAGYETEVGGGARDALPAGLGQGIAMARALASKPRLILFDEANSGFDKQSDAKLKVALESLKRNATIVLVSHRPSLLALADQTYDLADRKLIPRISVGDHATPSNDAPVASDASFTGPVEGGLAQNFAYGATDVDGDTLTYTITSQPAEGTVTDNGNGTFSFDPGSGFQDLAAGETRDVTFTYQVDDGNGGTDTATVSVTVTGPSAEQEHGGRRVS